MLTVQNLKIQAATPWKTHTLLEETLSIYIFQRITLVTHLFTFESLLLMRKRCMLHRYGAPYSFILMCWFVKQLHRKCNECRQPLPESFVFPKDEPWTTGIFGCAEDTESCKFSDLVLGNWIATFSSYFLTIKLLLVLLDPCLTTNLFLQFLVEYTCLRLTLQTTLILVSDIVIPITNRFCISDILWLM